MDDDSQALKSLLDLMFNLGAFDSHSDAEVNQERSPRIDQAAQVLDQLLDIDSETITEPPVQLEQSPPIANSNTSLAISSEPSSTIQPAKTEEGAIASLQSLLFGSDLQSLKVLVNNHDHKIQNLEHQIYDPQELIRLLVPVITDILGIKVSEASAEITKAIAPVIDEMIAVNIEQDHTEMSVALAPVMSAAITQNIHIAPGEFASAIAPEMGMAIHEQLRLNKGVMIDALYPIIGSTISKYLAEAIKAINEKVEHTLSPEGILRKFRARMQGVSEAELILKESMPVTIRAIFLIHKASGLIISEVQNPSKQILESEMVAGMLTAIRNFVNDCITESGFDTELSEIDYGGSKIMLEAAGCCYMAVVADGVTTPVLIGKIRHVLEAIVQVHTRDIENFDGDLATVPTEIKPALTQVFAASDAASKSNTPNILSIVILVLIAVIAIPWAIIHHHHQQQIQLKAQIRQALANAPELSVYGLGVDIDQDRVNLTGRVPNAYLKDLAGKIAVAAASDKSGNKSISMDNQIIPINIPPDPLLTKSEVKRVAAILNQLEGIKITAVYSFETKKVTITGRVNNSTHSKTLNAAFTQIPGVAIVTSTIQMPSPIPPITTRIYFSYNSLLVSESQIPKILQMKLFMDRYPSYQLKIIGHSDRLGDVEINRRFSLNRAQVVRDLLTKSGLAPHRSVAIVESGQSQLNPASNLDLNPDLNSDLNRYVGFELITTVDN